MEQGFAASGTASSAIRQTASRLPGAAHTPQPRAHKPEPKPAEIVGKGVALHGEIAKGERETEQTLRGAQNKLMLPGMIDFGGMILGTPLMWLAGKAKLSKTKATIGSVLKASGEALHKTETKNLFQLPANYMEAVAGQAAAAGVDGWATKATAASGALKVKGESVAGTVGKAFEGFKQSGFVKAMPNIMKSAAGKVGGSSLFTTLIVSGVVAGIGATLFGARAESKESKAAFKQLLEDVGGDKHSPFANGIKTSKQSKEKWATAKLGIELVGGLLDGVMWAKPGRGGVAMMGAVMLPQLCSGLVPENPLLGAYVALKKSDSGEVKLNADQRIELTKQLIAIMPSVAANGGVYNRLVTPVAREMVARNMNTVQVVQLLNNNEAFTAFAAEVQAKQKATKTETKATVKPVAAETTITGKAEASNAPKMQIGSIERQGTVMQAARAKQA